MDPAYQTSTATAPSSETEDATPPQGKIVPALAGIPETMLWTLYARASEARRQGGILRDPQALRIADALDYDFTARFGIPNPLFALRAALIDDVVRGFLSRQPDCLVISLGEGLETQCHRTDNGRMRWLSIDLPEAIKLRELFLAPTARFRHLAASALDDTWMTEAAAAAPPLIIMQGLLMYFEPADVRALFGRIAHRLPGAELVFDVVSRELSAATRQGHHQTDHYMLPAMPWGLNRNEIAPSLRSWGIKFRFLHFLPYALDRKRSALVEALLDRIVPRRQRAASLIHAGI